MGTPDVQGIVAVSYGCHIRCCDPARRHRQGRFHSTSVLMHRYRLLATAAAESCHSGHVDDDDPYCT